MAYLVESGWQGHTTHLTNISPTATGTPRTEDPE